MVFRRRILALLSLLLVFTLLLSACQRPFPRTDNGNNAQTNETTNETAPEDTNADAAPYPAPEDEEAVADTGSDDADAPAEEADETEGDAAAPTATPTEEAGDTPRVEEEPTPVPTETPVPEPTTAPEDEETADEEGEGDEAAEETPAEEETEESAEDAAADTTETADTDMPATHTVATGENLYRIGLQYGVSWVTLAELNNLNNPNSIRVGQELQLPGSDSAAPATPEPTPSPATETTYTVQSGDNLFRIGLQYGLSWVQIAEANGIVNPNQIMVGQVIKIPVEAPGPAPQFTHEVKQGETLFLISLQYGVPWPNIAEANELDSPYVIYPGQMLVIPGG